MHKIIRAGLIAAAAVLAAPLAGAGAHAAVITFETAPLGEPLTAPVTENGFSYGTLIGNLFVNHFGNPGHDMEGATIGQGGGAGGGVLNIVPATGSPVDFTFSGLDYAAFSAGGTGSQTLTVFGLLHGSIVGTDTYTLANTSTLVGPVTGEQYANWTTEPAFNLSGKTIDVLHISLNGGIGPDGNSFWQAVDNVVLGAPASVPEPASLALFGSALLGLGLLRRRRAA